VFLSKKGHNEPLRRWQAYHIIKDAARDAGLDPTRVGCHSCRKAFAKRILIASGNSLIAVQRLLGHASPMTSAAYCETTREELDDLVLSVDPLAPAAPAVGRSMAGPIPKLEVSLL
jgi:site-specific recombinase XerD